MTNYATPGVYIKSVVHPIPTQALHTGVPLFIGLVSADRLAQAPSQDFDTTPLPEGDGALMVVRSKRILIQNLAKTNAFQERRRRATPDYFLARLPDTNAAVTVEAIDAAVAEDPWLRHYSHTERFNLWPDFEKAYGALFTRGYLAAAIQGFFANNGRFCRLQMVSYQPWRATPLDALTAGLRAVEAADDIDLICAPDILWLHAQGVIDAATVFAMQKVILDHCDRLGNRFAILDALPDVTTDALKAQRQALRSKNGALYYPFVGVKPLAGTQPSTAETAQTPLVYAPPCGHIAGVYARTDEQIGVHKAPANALLQGVISLADDVDDTQQGELNPVNINCLRAFPTRGIRIWGARTLSDDDEWRYVNVRRLMITTARWVERNMMDETFEPHTPALRARIRREVTVYLDGLFQRGALRGNTAQEAYYVKCDEENNPDAVRDAGMIITEIGLAVAAPAEFMVVRLIADAAGVTIVEADK